jgi:hypothetical protein
MLGVTWLADRTGQITLSVVTGQIWALPFLIALYVLDTSKTNKWVVWIITTLLLSYPSAHAVQVGKYIWTFPLSRCINADPIDRTGWNSRNSNTVRSRTVSAAMYNMFCQASGVIASNIYREDDKPRYQRGNRQLIAIVSGNIIIYLLVGLYYRWVNARRDKVWDSWTDEQREEYARNTEAEGNKRLDFRFAY